MMVVDIRVAGKEIAGEGVIMFPDDLQVIIDTCTVCVRPGRLYTEDGLWVAWDEPQRLARLGLSDYRRQMLGEITFVELPERGMALAGDDEVANIETANIDLSLPAPFAGTVLAVNQALAEAPEAVNQDPYGAGWLVDLRPEVWPVPGLLDAQSFLDSIARTR